MAVGLKMVGGDFVINGSGKVEIVRHTDKCTRDFGKMLLTSKEYEGNETEYSRYNPNYGTELENRSLYSGLSRMSIREVIIGLLNKAIADYIRLQESRDNLDIGEIITNVNLDVYYDADDLRSLIVDISFGTAYGGGEISLGQFTQSVE